MPYDDRHDEPIRLYSAPVCPFAQRVRLALAEKGIDYELVDVDLEQAPDWFRDISPYGKVPLLVRGADKVWESGVINEYLEDIRATPALLPIEPGARAQARIWVDYTNTQFLPLFYQLLLEQTPARRAELAGQLDTSLRHMEQEGLGRSGGPYWLGKALSLADLAIYPFLERFPVLTHYRGYRLPADCTRLAAWVDTMAARPAVQNGRESDEFYIQSYRRYADGTVRGAASADASTV